MYIVVFLVLLLRLKKKNDSVPFADLAYSLKHCKFPHTKTSATNIETHDSRIANSRGSDADSQWGLRDDVNTMGLMLVFVHRSNT